MSHCDTCICSDSSSVDGLNARARRLVKQGKIKSVYPISPLLESRFVSAPKYQLGWNDFRVSSNNNTIVGWFLCGIKDNGKTRYFAIGTPPVGSPLKPFEYNVGDSFDISGQGIDKEHIVDYFNQPISDEYLSLWLSLSVTALHQYVEKQLVDGIW